MSITNRQYRSSVELGVSDITRACESGVISGSNSPAANRIGGTKVNKTSVAGARAASGGGSVEVWIGQDGANRNDNFPQPPVASRGITARKPRPPKFYRIGEVVDYSGMSRQTIHNYTTMGLLHESGWTAGGHRLYDESAFERLDLIAEMKTHADSLQTIREFFARKDASQSWQFQAEVSETSQAD